MKKEITDERLINLIENGNDKELEALIETDSQLQEQYDQLREVLTTIEHAGEAEVPVHIGMNVRDAIYQEQAKNSRRFSWLQVAAAIAILVVGFGFGRLSPGSGTSTELMALKEEVQSLKELTLTSTLQNHTASERILAVNRIGESTINPELIATLINTLNSDDSPNVRYAALQALTNYLDHSDVRTELVKSLESQSDALIQISLITILVEAEERSAIAPLKEIMEQEEITPEVRQQAEIAIQVLT